MLISGLIASTLYALHDGRDLKCQLRISLRIPPIKDHQVFNEPSWLASIRCTRRLIGMGVTVDRIAQLSKAIRSTKNQNLIVFFNWLIFDLLSTIWTWKKSHYLT